MIEVYYVEDDPDIAQSVKIYLELHQMNVSLFHSVAAAKKALFQTTPDILLLDCNMPDSAGDALCRWMRNTRGSQIPILYLTVQGETADIVRGFSDGADDYIVKPFALEVLYVRIRSLLRRVEKREETRLSCGNILLDTEKMAVFCAQEEVQLSQSEYKLLLLLMENKGKTVTRKQLLEQIWDCDGNFVNDNTLTVTIKRLREKLHHPACLKTIRSFGYRMEEVL